MSILSGRFTQVLLYSILDRLANPRFNILASLYSYTTRSQLLGILFHGVDHIEFLDKFILKICSFCPCLDSDCFVVGSVFAVAPIMQGFLCMVLRPSVKRAHQKLFFLLLNQNICCGQLKESSQWGGSFEHTNNIETHG